VRSTGTSSPSKNTFGMRRPGFPLPHPISKPRSSTPNLEAKEFRAAKRANADARWETQAHSREVKAGLKDSRHVSSFSAIWEELQKNGGTSFAGEGVHVTA